ncbi:hypothetical protein [Nocardia sp. NBC_01329]|uniref:hypothetical protein n=1 Tax=Nocardia sp. NBC_01329 TaxID=2903594 RepID=UPI002E11E72B|nr:hypothetical protein OG405_00670 [Nocardia sp. NBC_01329]
MVRVGAVHLGWDVVSVAAGGSGVPIRPVQVEGSYNPPAYLLADASGRLYTAGADRQRPDLGMAIPDVREILGHPQIVIAGATWPAELVFRARLYNPLAAVGTYLRGKPDVVALPYPDDWPDEKIDAYAQLVEQLDVEVEPIPESIALSGYVRALGLVRPPDPALPEGVGATAVHFDGHVVDGRANVLVVAVHGDDERPTESVYVPIDPESTRDPRVADDTVIEVMAAARSIGADNSTVLLAGQVVFNETLRFAFRNHLGQRLKKAEHPMHALVLGATHLLISENEEEDEDDGPAHYPQPGPNAPMPQPDPGASAANYAVPGRPASGPGPNGPAPGPNPPGSYRPAPGPHPPVSNIAPPGPPGPSPYGPPDQDPTVKVERGELPPPITGPPSRFTRPPDPATGNQSAVPPGSGRPDPGRNGPAAGDSRAGAEPDGDRGKGKLWNKMKDNLFGAHAVIGVAALAATAWGAQGAGTAPAYPETGIALAGWAAPGSSISTATVSTVTAGCVPMPRAAIEPHGRSATGDDGPGDPDRPLYARVPTAPGPGDSVRGVAPEPGSTEKQDRAECAEPGIDTLRYLVPGLPGIADPGPPIDI